MTPRLAVALDVPDAQVALAYAERLSGHADLLKIGLELFTAQGPDLVRRIVEMGWDVFLDLKLHDIPATAAGAVAAADGLDAALLTLHTAGGSRMLEAAAAARRENSRLRLVGVTVLTSLDGGQLAELGIRESTAERVSRLCRLASRSGCDGVVASVHEAAAIKESCGDDFLVVTPGIRPTGAASHDQARVATPAAAVRAGSDVLVVGRPILAAADPVAAADAIREEMAKA